MPCGTSCLWMNVIVFMPFIPCLRPCVNYPYSFAADSIHACLNLGWHRRARYSRRSLVLWSRTAFACSWRRWAMQLAMLSVATGGLAAHLALTHCAILLVCAGGEGMVWCCGVQIRDLTNNLSSGGSGWLAITLMGTHGSGSYSLSLGGLGLNCTLGQSCLVCCASLCWNCGCMVS